MFFWRLTLRSVKCEVLLIIFKILVLKVTILLKKTKMIWGINQKLIMVTKTHLIKVNNHNEPLDNLSPDQNQSSNSVEDIEMEINATAKTFSETIKDEKTNIKSNKRNFSGAVSTISQALLEDGEGFENFKLPDTSLRPQCKLNDMVVKQVQKTEN